jgi:hypothetical protein
MPAGNPLGVANPTANNMDREVVEKLGLTRRSQVLPDLWPRLETGPFDQPNELSVRVVPGQDNRQQADLVGWCFFEDGFDQQTQFRPERNDPLGLAIRSSARRW